MTSIEKPLTLTIDQVNFNEIIAGTKKEEYRSLSDFYISRFCIVKNGNVVGVKPIKAVRLAVGYARDRKWAIIEIKGIFIDTFEKGNKQGFDEGFECFTLELGNILEKNF
ncbi:MAG: hypothetical protein ACYCZO_10105 [Daejeonella sp.]